MLRNTCFCILCSFITPFLLQAAERPNIILIMSDDMGYSDIGCYGSEIETPNLDRLASNGIRFTQFYNTARCCPTRASLMTGLHPHQAGLGHMTGIVHKVDEKILPGYEPELNQSCVTIAEALQSSGYSTYGVGKWHLARMPHVGGDRRNWPHRRGFDKFYGIIDGATNYFEPATLVRNDKPISYLNDPEYTSDGDYYFTNAISDNAVRYIECHGKESPEKPFFMYVAYTAAHWPMQALPEDIAKYRGKYDHGYEAVRSERYRRMKNMGLVDGSWKLSPQAEDWNAVEDKRWEASCMEVYAAMIDCMDQGIGRIVQSLEKKGMQDNTVILFLQDNGACAEGAGRSERKDFPNRPEKPVFAPYPPEKIIFHREDEIRTRDGFPIIHGKKVLPGPRDTFIAYGRGWANVSNTPYREYKHWVHEGGIATPLIVHAPSLVPDAIQGTFCNEYGQLIDIMTTCVDLANAEYPEKYHGENILPMPGTSLTPAFSGKALNRTVPLFWEHEGNRAVRDGKWKLVAMGSASIWELYDMENDRSEMENVAANHPEIVAKMRHQWENWAHKSNVLPWPWERMSAEKDFRPGVKFELIFDETKQVDDRSGNKNQIRIHGEIHWNNIDSRISAQFDGKTWMEIKKDPSLPCEQTPLSIKAEICADSAEGVVLSHGGSLHGYSLYLKDARPGFAVRLDGKPYHVDAEQAIAGWRTISGRMTTKKSIQILVDDKVVAEKSVPGYIVHKPFEPVIVGADRDGRVATTELPAFKGLLKRIEIFRESE